MEIPSDDRRAYVRLIRQRTSCPDGRDLTVAVQMHASGFSGRYGEVGIFADELRRFVATLGHLERQRAGAATLRSMSPDEFTLTITVTDRAAISA